MKKRNNILFLLFVTMGMTGCNYMDELPYERSDAEDIFSSEALYERPTTQAYSYLKGGMSRVDDAFLEAATDNGTSVVYDSKIHTLAQGFATSNTPVEECWKNSYKGIHQALYAIENYRKYTLRLQNKTPEEIEQTKKTLIAELNALRAVFEFDLLRHYGGYPIIDKVYELGSEEIRNIRRSSFADCVNHIIGLCDAAAADLNVEPRGAAGGYGNMTKGAALAIKAKTLVYAASPLYNQTTNTNPLLGYVGSTDVTTKWQTAAKACADVINLKKTNGQNKYTLNTDYEKLFIIQPNNNTEYIVTRNSVKANGLEERQYPPALSRQGENKGGGTVPSQEFVDAFTMADGSQFVRSTTTGAEQYIGRDPRLYSTIVYNAATFGTHGTIYTRRDPGDNNGLNTVVRGSTTTGYYLKKFLDLNVKFNGVQNPATAFHYYPIIRLADVLLMYSEAMTLGYGIDTDPEGFGLTAKGAIEMVRRRAGFTTTDKFLEGVTTPEKMLEKIKQERRIELSFEEHRYFDLRRWLDAEQSLNQNITGVEIQTIAGEDHYSYFTVDSRRSFSRHMYYHPIPLQELRNSPNIEQNPGW